MSTCPADGRPCDKVPCPLICAFRPPHTPVDVRSYSLPNPPSSPALGSEIRRDVLAREIVRRRGRYAYAYSERGAVEVVRSVLDELAAILNSETAGGTP